MEVFWGAKGIKHHKYTAQPKIVIIHVFLKQVDSQAHSQYILVS